MKQLPINQLLSPRQKNILHWIKNSPQISSKNLLEKLHGKFGNVARITLIRDLNDLLRKKYIARIGEGRTMRYVPHMETATETMNNDIPKNFRRYFWDTDPEKLSLTKHATYIIERILEWGNLEAVKWLRRHYSRKELLGVLDTSRRISNKSRNFWKIIFSPNNALPICIPKSLENQQEKIWKY